MSDTKKTATWRFEAAGMCANEPGAQDDFEALWGIA